MASDSVPPPNDPHRSVAPLPIGATHPVGKREASQLEEAWDFVRAILAPIASLKFTVVLFAMAIFIVLAGTLGQTEADIWQVVDHYFRMPAHVDAYTSEPMGWFHATFAQIQYKIFFPKSFFPEMPEFAWLENHFYFPKGWTIGALMFANLLAAHLVRFRIQSNGPRLATGAIVLTLGTLLTYAVVHSGAMGGEVGVQDAAWLDWDTIWTLMKLALAALWLAIGVFIIRMDPAKSALRLGLGIGELVFGAALIWLFLAGNDLPLGDSSMRILWQLIKATSAGVALLAGCMLVFKQRAGIVLLHAGIGLMMFSELLVGLSAVESQLTAQEGQAKNYSEDTREVELAIVDPSSAETDEVTVISGNRLHSTAVVSDEILPFDVKLIEYIPNSPDLRKVAADDSNPATAGIGLQYVPVPEKRSVGTDSNQKVDIPAAYVELIAKEGEKKSLGTYLLPVITVAHWSEWEHRPERVQVGDKAYDIALRFKRIYRPFWIEVLDARQDNYTGTTMAQNYSSDVRIVDAEGRELLNTRIWMNNPLRYNGETYYQSEFRAKGMPGVEADTTTLQVVTNKGWMIPYVSCMIVAVGMMHQFGTSLFRFVRRRARSAPSAGIVDAVLVDSPLDKRLAAVEAASQKPRKPRREPAAVAKPGDPMQAKLAWYLPLGVTAVAALWAISTAARPLPKVGGMNIEAAGRLPIMEDGRCKPLDTVARSTLRVLSKRETFVDENGKRQPALRWLLDVISDADGAGKQRVFRIENFDVQDALGVPRRQGFLYSADEIQAGRLTFEQEYVKAIEARSRDPKHLTVAQKQIIDFSDRIGVYDTLKNSFQASFKVPSPLAANTPEAMEQARTQLMKDAEAFQRELVEQRRLEVRGAPLAIPTRNAAAGAKDDTANGDNEPWTTLVGGQIDAFVHSLNLPQLAEQTESKQPSAARGYWVDLLAAYKNGDAERFNTAVTDYRDYLGDHPPIVYQAGRVNYEAFFNRAEPFYVASWLYLGVFLLALGGLFGWSVPLNRAAFWLTAFTFALHTFALISRVYISGRPPVTTLYSSAVFIGWGGVVLAMAMESIFKLGLGNMLAGIMGSGTLLIAHFLSLDGDTFPVLQAVLDTQFWLATHVVTVTAGYAATFVAGVLGVLYVVLGVCTPSLDSRSSNVLARMIYGSFCFAIFFSFVGTVLGGLWADDSWGRFWGWDPKENGALIIVLWNALVLHARWDGWIRDRGMAVMAMVGNVVTAWSWFGVNNLDVGLHSYGKSESAITALMVFWVAQLALVGVGLLPKKWWLSFREQARTKST